ncbi:hypothetical protein Tco_0936970 [Tanacetum coccineum]|uniref:Uncharacterized protein n=1 Tax=Tanacetum coccineum TaxID=301880 RepID=A0ABQ5DDS5_9ASTR
MDLIAFINHVDPTKVRIEEREVKKGEVPLLELTRGRVVLLTGVKDQGDANIQDVGHDVVNEEGATVGQENPVDADIVRIEDEVPAIVAEKAKGSRKKRKAVGGASGSNLPPKKLRADHGTSGVGASTGGKFRTQRPVERFVVLSDSPCHSSSNAADAEVSSVVMSLVPDPPIIITAVATTVIVVASFVLVPRAGDEPVHASIFAESTSADTVGPDIAGPSQPAGTELSADAFYVSQDMDSKTLRQIYVPKWNVVNESALDDPDVYRSLVDQFAPPVLFSQLCGMDYDQLFAEFNVGAARQTCLGAEVRMRTEHILREKKKLEGRCSRQADLLKENDVEIASLKA